MMKIDLKGLVNSELVGQLTKQLNVYEKKAKQLVKEFDIRSRDAREKSRRQLDKFASQLKKTRADLEKRVTEMVNHESKRLNQGVTELFNYLKSIASNEKLAGKSAALKKKSGKTGEKTTGKKAVSRKPKAKSTVAKSGESRVSTASTTGSEASPS